MASGLFEDVLNVYKNTLNFKGVTGQLEYIHYNIFLFCLSVPIVFLPLLGILMYGNITLEITREEFLRQLLFYGIWLLILLIPYVALSVRRFRDVGCPIWLYFIPVVGFTFNVALLFAPSAGEKIKKNAERFSMQKVSVFYGNLFNQYSGSPWREFVFTMLVSYIVIILVAIMAMWRTYYVSMMIITMLLLTFLSLFIYSFMVLQFMRRLLFKGYSKWIGLLGFIPGFNIILTLWGLVMCTKDRAYEDDRQKLLKKKANQLNE